MQIIRLEDSTELESAKNAMFRALITMLACYFLSVVPLVGLLASVVMLGAIVWYLVGVYRFSKLTNSPIFAKHMLIIALVIGAITLVIGLSIAAAQDSNIVENIGLYAGIFVVFYLATIILAVWIQWGILAEFGARTNLKQFALVFKFYIGSFVLTVIGIILCVIAVDSSVWIHLSQAALSQNTLQTLDASKINFSLFSVAMLIYALALIASILSFVFYMLGIAKITEVSVKEAVAK